MGGMSRKPGIDLNRASWRARTGCGWGVDRGLGGGAMQNTGRGATTRAVGAHGWPCSNESRKFDNVVQSIFNMRPFGILFLDLYPTPHTTQI